MWYWRKINDYDYDSIEYFRNSIWIYYCLFVCFQQLANYITYGHVHFKKTQKKYFCE